MPSSHINPPILGSLNQTEKDAILSGLETVIALPGEIILHEDDLGDFCYFIVDGQLEVVKKLGTNDEHVVGLEVAGSLVGEGSLFFPELGRSASVRARIPTRLLRMTHSELESLLRSRPGLAFEMARHLSQRQRDIDNAIIQDLHVKNEQLATAYEALKQTQAQLVEKEKMEQELKVGRDIQRSILPRRPEAKRNFDFGVLLEPARLVGGDLYDFIMLDDDKMAILIGDVSDKGVPAAIFMALVRSLFRAESYGDATPSHVLECVNNHLLDMNERGLFVTVLFGILDLLTGEFAYGRAGHEFPLLFDYSKQLQKLPFKSGRPLGILEEIAIEEDTLVIPSGGSLILFTDGAIDAIDPNENRFGYQRLINAAATTAAQEAQVTCDHIWRKIQAFSGKTSQVDDIALVALHRGLI